MKELDVTGTTQSEKKDSQDKLNSLAGSSDVILTFDGENWKNGDTTVDLSKIGLNPNDVAGAIKGDTIDVTKSASLGINYASNGGATYLLDDGTANPAGRAVADGLTENLTLKFADKTATVTATNSNLYDTTNVAAPQSGTITLQFHAATVETATGAAGT